MTGYFKKIIFFTFIFFSCTFTVSAPSIDSLIIVDADRIEPFKNLIRAIGIVETKCDTMAYNPIEEAAGYFQIRPVRLTDYNNRTGSKYSKKDLFRYEISEKIFLYYASRIGPYDLERIAKKWNGSGHSTIHYWNRIKKYL